MADPISIKDSVSSLKAGLLTMLLKLEVVIKITYQMCNNIHHYNKSTTK